MNNVRKILLNEVISQFKTITKPDNISPIFESVQKSYVDFPDNLPACAVMSRSTSINERNLNFDQVVFSFSAIVYELIEAGSTQTQQNESIDRLADIEFSLLKYIEKIPGNFEDKPSYNNEFEVYDSEFTNSQYLDILSSSGVEYYLTVDFDLKVNIAVKLL